MTQNELRDHIAFSDQIIARFPGGAAAYLYEREGLMERLDAGGPAAQALYLDIQPSDVMLLVREIEFVKGEGACDSWRRRVA